MAKPAKTYTLEAVIDLPAGLSFGPEFLGLLKSATIGGVDVHVVLPDFVVQGGAFVAQLHPRAREDWLGWFARNGSDDDARYPFGEVFAWQGNREILQFSVPRLLVLAKGRVTRAKARGLLRAVDDWAQLLETWIEVFAREDLHQERVTANHLGQSAAVWINAGKAGGGKFVRDNPHLTINFGSRLAITPRQWGRLLAKTSLGATPPEAHVFLRDARNARNAHRYRRSVLDSATATELGLAKLRDSELAGSRAPLGKYVRGKAQQISGLSEFLSVMGRQLPKRIQQEIGEPRNKAIHEGRESDEETASKALEKAEEVVDLAFPWKRLL